VVLLIVVYFKTTRSDLGLPASKREFAHDVYIGVVAVLAAFAPVYIIQGKLLHWLGMPETKSGHQLVKMVTEGEASVGLLLLVSIAAVVVAPVFEEIVFRLLLQGWLEKWEAEQVFAMGDESRRPNDELPQSGDSAAVVDRSTLNCPPAEGVAGLPFGFVPIAISSLLFGLAHFGYGPAPVSLFFLALVLGYVYYRTHRIVPCIVAHFLFNLYSVIGIWRMVYHGTQ
jgi:membrane protease YdiL (CAAX protease family)